MSLEPVNLNVLGVEIAFKPGADMERARRAARYVEERYDQQRLKAEGSQGKDMLLTFLALGLADELLQIRSAQAATRLRLESLLEKIEMFL